MIFMTFSLLPYLAGVGADTTSNQHTHCRVASEDTKAIRAPGDERGLLLG